MPEIIILLLFLIFSIFLVLGVVSHIKRTAGKWIYYCLAAISFIGVLYMLFFQTLNIFDQGKPIKSPTVETPVDSGKNNGPDPVKEDPPVKENPPPETPNEGKPDNPTPETPEKINVPPDEIVKYEVVNGDTLYSIATRAEVTVVKIKQWNNLKSDVIYAGQILKLYGKNVEPPPPVEPPKQDPPPATASSALISNGSLQKKEIALTFDAGSDAAGIAILDVLKKYNLKATFFLTGKWVEKYPVLAKRIADEGHEIGNHSYSHPDAVKTTAAAFKQDILKADQAIKKATGKSPQPYFRFPFGSYNPAALKTVGQAGYPYSIQWSLDTIDWQQPSTETLVSRIKAGASNGDIILMHIGGINTPEAVDTVIPWLQAQGYQLVTLTELLN
ncbi:polysaccharide deacetylase family protein [Paenibacillus sp. BSR1-1]|uniref:polysaccharide deacetylase family protein n=1 Tax=Paenibacillus sp. BSR1-1 TaxID=3020845 RepID=UPI0025B12CF8|nr:polysaccharide deacetylase family protein [Paenibacillus sp. BSR1-1]MDN3017014.1 polysaccharide deacetylase family protein [Paenibacillus sp. BSR1-1]